MKRATDTHALKRHFGKTLNTPSKTRVNLVLNLQTPPRKKQRHVRCFFVPRGRPIEGVFV